MKPLVTLLKRKTKKLSIVVCSYNGEDRIEDCLTALSKQTVSREIEIIVVDDGSKDATAFIAKLTLEKLGVDFQVIEFKTNKGLSAARNAGVKAAKSKFIAFTDDDCRPEPSWAEKIISVWKVSNASVQGIGGLVKTNSSNTFNKRFLGVCEPLRPIEIGRSGLNIFSKILKYINPKKTKSLVFLDSVVGANMSFRKSSIIAVGGFDDEIKFGGDELYLCEAIRKKYGNESLLFNPKLVVNHEFHPSFKDTLRRSYQYGKGNGRRWVQNKGIPSFLPGVALQIIAGSCAYLAFNPMLGFLAYLLAPLVTGQRLLTTKGDRPKEQILYPFAQLVCEAADNMGLIMGIFTNLKSKYFPNIDSVVKQKDRNESLSEKNSAGVKDKVSTPTLLWIGATILASIYSNGWPSMLVLTATMILFPGMVLMSCLGFNTKDRTTKIVASASVGLTFTMIVGALLSWFGPRLGIDRPLDKVPLIFVWSMILAILITVSIRRKIDPCRWLLGETEGFKLYNLLYLLIFPIAAALLAARLNNFGSGWPSLALIIVSATIIIWLTAVTWSSSKNLPIEAIVGSITLAMAWSTTLRGYGLFGWDIQQELGVAKGTIASGIWSIPSNADAYASMLSLTVLPAQLYSIAGIAPEYALRWVYPVALALVASGCVAAGRKYSKPGPVVLALTLVMLGTTSFARQIPAIGRQEIAFLLFTTLILAVTSTEVEVKKRRYLALIAGIGLGFAHYTTSYVTGFMLILVVIITPILTGKGVSKQRVLSLWVCFGIIGSTVLWNGVITRPASELNDASVVISDTGIRFLDNNSKNPIASWLRGTGPQLTAYAKYSEQITERRDELGWFTIDPKAEEYKITDASAPNTQGLLPFLKGPWTLLHIIAKQLVTVLIIISLLWYFRKVTKNKNETNVELLVLGIGALIITAILRVSSTAGLLYNPERAAIHGGIVFSAIIAMFLSHIKVKKIIPISLATILIITSWGLTVPAFGGNPIATYSTKGEDVERYVTAQADGATSKWISTVVPKGSLVHADRYGRVSLLAYETRNNFTIIDSITPNSVHRPSYVLFTSMNTRTGRARGQIDTSFSIFTSPEEFFYNTRTLVYSTGETHVYR